MIQTVDLPKEEKMSSHRTLMRPKVGELSGTQNPAAATGMHMWGKGGKDSPLMPPPLDSTLASSVGVQKAWRQPGEGRLLYIWDGLLLNWSLTK
jgi:hypothetical protein